MALEIVPSIVANDFFEIEEKIRAVEGIVKTVHIDIADGRFASPKTWPYTQDNVELITKLQDIDTSVAMELHLMVQNPEEDLDEWLDTPAGRIYFHYEATEDPEQPLTVLDMSKEEAGMALNVSTAIDVLEPLIDRLDCVQLMSTAHLGGYGGGFDPSAVAKIKAFRKLYPKMALSVDGGLSNENLLEIKAAGATRAVVGSAIFKEVDPIRALTELIDFVS